MESTPSGSVNLHNVALPQSFKVTNFAGARIKEIQAMRKSIKETTGNKLAFQKLPRHMRRRTMSHMIKRLPRRLREIHSKQMAKSGLPPKNKRPSRKYRRRPRNLLSEYERRKRRIKWLDTHIWHAKRFHMIEKWGYKLPKQPCDKSFRACYRATMQHCLLQDLSYWRCIEIGGAYEQIVTRLAKITDSTVGLTFAAKCYSEGKKFGNITIFDVRNAQQAIGEVEFLWDHKVSNGNRKLWMFAHPAYYRHTLNVLLHLFDFIPKLEKGSLPIKKYINTDGTVLRELEYELGKLRLTGPLATSVLQNALNVPEQVDDTKGIPNWFHNYPRTVLLNQNDVFKLLKETSYIPPNLVLSVTAWDPRLNLPSKRTKATIDTTFSDENIDRICNNLSLSPLYDDNVRKLVADNKLSNAKICEMRSSLLVPGSELVLKETSLIPVILLWRTGNKTTENNGYSSGWDIILPSSWTQSFFFSFVMWGARVGGLRETERIAFEGSRTDLLYPDTVAGEVEENYITDTAKEAYFRLPPNKRTNYNKFSIVSPLKCNWRLLISDWSGRACDQFTVVRNKRLLKSVQEFMTSKTSPLPTLPEHCLIPVQITMLKKGVCTPYSILALPEAGDLKSLPEEPKRTDQLARKRRSLRQQHKSLLKRLRQRRRRAKTSGKPIVQADVNDLLKYKEEMRSLWLPEPTTIKNSCSRSIIGFVKYGDYSFTLGRTKGLGYIAGDSLRTLRDSRDRNKILIRNPNSRHYHGAVIDVVVE